MAVMQRLEFVAANYFVLKLLDLFIIKLYQRAALRADEVVVMLVLVLVLVERAPVMKFKLASQAALFQQLQRAIDGREPYGRVFGFDDRIQVFARDVPFCVEKHVEDQIALRRSLQPRALEVLVEYLYLFALHNNQASTDWIIHLWSRCAKLYIDTIE